MLPPVAGSESDARRRRPGVRGGGDGRHRGPHVLLHPAVHRAPDHVEKTRAHRPSNDGRQHRAQVSIPWTVCALAHSW